MTLEIVLALVAAVIAFFFGRNARFAKATKDEYSAEVTRNEARAKEEERLRDKRKQLDARRDELGRGSPSEAVGKILKVGKDPGVKQ